MKIEAKITSVEVIGRFHTDKTMIMSNQGLSTSSFVQLLLFLCISAWNPLQVIYLVLPLLQSHFVVI